jgi:hypothetical protein
MTGVLAGPEKGTRQFDSEIHAKQRSQRHIIAIFEEFTTSAQLCPKRFRAAVSYGLVPVYAQFPKSSKNAVEIRVVHEKDCRGAPALEYKDAGICLVP